MNKIDIRKLLCFATCVAGLGAVAFDTQTAAFYAFKEAVPGTTPETLVNATGDDTYEGTASVYNDGETGVGSMAYDSDAPGKYIFEDVTVDFPEAVATDVQSIHLSSATDAYSGGLLSFANVATLVSGLENATIEFFFNIPADEPNQHSYKANLGFKVNGDENMIGLAVPRDSSAAGQKVSLFEKSSRWGKYTAERSAALADCKWHHLAIVKTGNSYVAYLDSNGEAVDASDPVTCASSAVASEPFYFGSGSYLGYKCVFHGKVSCLRVSKTALSPARFLRASNLEHYYALREGEEIEMPDALAYYTFKEGLGRAGESASGDSLVNDIVSSNYMAIVTADGETSYCDDSPGPYVFDGLGYKDAFTTNPLSLNLQGGNVEIRHLATAVSKLSEATIEFFWKIDPSVSETHFGKVLDPGFTIRDTAAAQDVTPYLVTPLGRRDSNYGNQVRFWTANSVESCLVSRYPAHVIDGKWHHVAVVYSNETWRLYADYVAGKRMPEETEATWSASVNALAEDLPMQLGAKGYNGKISCLRVSKKALDANRMLRVSQLPTCIAPTVYHFPFEEIVPGSAVTAVAPSNDAPLFAAYNPTQYSWGTETTMSCAWESNGNAAVGSGKRPCAQVRAGASGSVAADCVSVFLEPNAVGASTFAAGPGIKGKYGFFIDGSQSAEGFFRFDLATYQATVGQAFGTQRNRVSLINLEDGSSNPPWSLLVEKCNESNPVLHLDCKIAGGEVKKFSYPLGASFADRWHHFAVTYDAKANKVSAWYDREKVIEETLSAPLDFSNAVQYHIGKGGNNQPFAGNMDEIRLSYGVLDAEDFIHKVRGGMLLIYR